MTHLFSEDQAIVTHSEDGTQISVHKFEKKYLRVWNKNLNEQNKNSGF